MKLVLTSFLTIFVLSLSNFNVNAQCANSSNIYSFEYSGKTYEIIKENKTWIEAAACAVERGGILAEVNDSLEQDTIFSATMSAGIYVSNTIAPDGGGKSYIWIGGNDLVVEGEWVWDGDNDTNSVQFWQGTWQGNPVNGLYNNWGGEPDNFSGQDALGISLDGWPFGDAGQWNDVDHDNTLYYVVEHPSILGTDKSGIINNDVNIYPNPFTDLVNIVSDHLAFNEIIIYNSLGQEVKYVRTANTHSEAIDLSSLNSGIYLMKISSKNGESITKILSK